MDRYLREDRLIETAERLCRRIGDRFPGSGLCGVAGEVLGLTRESLVKAARIGEPNWWLRAGYAVVAVLAVAGGVLAWRLQDEAGRDSLVARVLQLLDQTKGAAVYLSGAAIFLVTLEVRLKRSRVVRAVHELRALAHIIDMHQLAKDPERVAIGKDGQLETGKAMSAEAMGYYLNYCTELLALLSKIGQLYVEDFADPPTLAAVNQLESLTTGLSGKIWQKLMILDRIRADAPRAAVG